MVFYQERAAFDHEKKRLFLIILSDLGIFNHLWLFNMNGRLFITKKDCFWSFYQIQVFLVICGFYQERAAFYHEKRLFLIILSDSGIFSLLRFFIMNWTLALK